MANLDLRLYLYWRLALRLTNLEVGDEAVPVMKLEIRPTVDFVFKILIGTVVNRELLIDLLNDILQPNPPIA